MSSFRRNQPQARLVVRLATPAVCVSQFDCDSVGFQGRRNLTTTDYNEDVERRYNPVLRTVAHKFGAAVADAWGLWASYPLVLQRRIAADKQLASMSLHAQCEVNRKYQQDCGRRNNSELSLALASQLKFFLCPAPAPLLPVQGLVN